MEGKKIFGFVCVLCGDVIEGSGNNPAPLATKGECCDHCNAKVLKARLKEIPRHGRRHLSERLPAGYRWRTDQESVPVN